jgi:GT2 family glycosyltransferase
VFYYPNSKVVHYVGRSSNDTRFIERTFEHSRHVFFKKYHGLFWGTIGEVIIRIVNLPARVL